MKKRLLLLPLLGGLVLSGCSLEDLMFWKKKDGGNTTDSFEFIVEDMETPYFGEDPRTPQTFEYKGMTFLDREAYYSSQKGCLWFYNQWSDNLDGDKKATEETVFAFIANQTAFEKGITKIEITTASGTGGPQCHVAFGESAFTESQAVSDWKKITASTEKTYSFSSDGKSKYFCISPRGDVGYIPKNFQVSSIKVYFGK